MITGFNTDVKHGDTVYHVQTEDKGVKNPLLLSLIYVKGAILDAFRVRYEDFLTSGRFSEALLQRILDFQHRQIVGAIKRGKCRKGMALEPFVEGDFLFPLTPAADAPPTRKPEDVQPAPESAAVTTARLEVEPKRIEPASPESEARLPLDVPPVTPMRARTTSQGPLLSTTRPDRFSQVLAVDINDAVPEAGVEICLLGSKDFVAGDQVDLELYVQSRQGRIRLENVQVVIKLIGTTFSPRLYAGKTDQFGSLRMSFSLPIFSGGSAALIIQVSTAVGNDEVKYLVRRRR
ncbi:MAG: hypothetical protein FJW26_18070 [Acidimicrobiia bacterium]|nr:hypothetical protein [Acidimicrobiia bacterium]